MIEKVFFKNKSPISPPLSKVQNQLTNRGFPFAEVCVRMGGGMLAWESLTEQIPLHAKKEPRKERWEGWI